MITVAKSLMAGDSANPLDPRSFLQVFPLGSNYIGVQSSDALQYPLATEISGYSGSVLTNTWNGSFTFTPKFFGTMAFTPNTFPTGITQGIWRTHDSFTRWTDIETSKGVYSPTNLAYLDFIVNTAFSIGADVMYTVYRTPAWAVTGGDTTKPPTNLADLTSWLNFLYARYGNKIKYYEGWNEPNILNSFNGNMAALVAHQQTIYSTVKANNSSLIVLSPCFGMKSGISTDTLNLAAYFTAGGAAYADSIAYHYYKSFSAPSGTHLDFDRTLPALVKAQCVSSGVSKPISNTETGSSTHTFNRLIENYVFSATQSDMALVYSWDAVGYSDMRLSLRGIAEWNKAVNFLNGKTMTAINSFGNGDFGVVLNGVGYLISGLGDINAT
jgi:hypothetical protein